ncbi:imelysin family protein [Altibacter sp. HG106]|uniref:imelysin family protein n=1 Tax=Altibacter sp. HG106 TaxID=3023937 RepID=UPI002350E6F1|nr:imelysin family protein [Altibacter sp. HG106]MDC7996272.1 imelysin family protein [Altibacter sp. HG106]
MLRSTLLFFCLFGLLSCATDESNTTTADDDSNPSAVDFDRSAMLEHWADALIIPGYDQWNTELTALQMAASDFTMNPTETSLRVVREQWITAYTMWQRVAMFEMGPAERSDLRLSVNSYPTNTSQIENHILEGGYDLTLPANRTAKGFPALDYLLNGIGTTDAERLAVYTGANGTAYQQYLSDVITDLNTLSNSVLTEWQNDYRTEFISNDGASATASTDRLVNDYIFYYEKFLRAGKMGIPLGVFTGTPEPQTLEAFYYPSLGNALFLEALDATQDFFNGTPFNGTGTGPSLASYLDTLNTVTNGATLSESINEQFVTARNAVMALETFKVEIEENDPPTTMLNAYDEVQALVPLLKVDMVSAMSIRIDYVDADGD